MKADPAWATQALVVFNEQREYVDSETAMDLALQAVYPAIIRERVRECEESCRRKVEQLQASVADYAEEAERLAALVADISS